MKRKRPAPAPKAAAIQAEEPPVWLAPTQAALFTALLFLAMTVQTGRMSVILPVLALALSVGRGPLRRLRERFCVPVIGFAAFALLYGAAALHSSFGGYAVREFYKFLASSALAVLLLARFDRRHVRALLWGFAGVCAVIGLVCVDCAIDGELFRDFNAFAESLGGSFSGLNQQTWGTRVQGIYNDANVSASLLALGALAGLHLTPTGEHRLERLLASVLTGMNGMSFFLAMSRGAILCFGLALLVYLAAVGKAARTRLFFLAVLNVGVTVGLSVPAASAVSQGSALADGLTLACGPAVWVLYEFPGLWAAKRLEGRGRALALVAAALVLAAGAYGAAAFRLTGPYTFGEGGLLYRTLEVLPGEYSLSAQYTGELKVRVSFTPEGGETERLYGDGPAEECAFTVPEAGQLGFFFWGESGETLESAVLSDGTEIPLAYPLLPDFLVSRLQSSLLEGSSFTQRAQYLRDGWKLFLWKPLTGLGLGCTEGWLTAVQPYYYESLFLHNHILQVMCEMGLLGLAAFLALLLGSLWLLPRRLRETWNGGGDPLAAVLLSCWVMMNGHSLMEINFSIRAYQCVAYLLLLLPVLLYARPAEAPESGKAWEKAAKWGGTAVLVCLLGYLGVFAAGVESHRAVERESRSFETGNVHAFLEKTRAWIRRDPFDKEQNQLNFVGNAVLAGDARYEEDMVRYAEALRSSGTYSACTGLARYYYLPRGELAEVFACMREGIAQEASSKDAWNQQIDFCRDTLLPAAGAEDADAYLSGVLSLKDYLEEYSQGRMEEIRLTEENAAFLDRAAKARENGLEGAAALLYLTIPGE